MATSNPTPVPNHITNDPSPLDALKEQATRLQSELEAERKISKQLRREKSYDVQQTRDLEQVKATVALKDLRTKLHLERVKEQEILKDSLNRKFDADQQKVIRQKDAELNKLRNNLRKCQDDLEQTREQINQNKRGLSGLSARGAFDNERQRLLSDVQELRTSKRLLEAQVRTMTEAEKQKTVELHKAQEQARCDVMKVEKEADTEIKRLLEELKSKDRLAWQKEKENGDRGDYSAATKLLLETPPVPMVTAELTNGVKECVCSCQKTDSASSARNGTNHIPEENASPTKKDPGGALQRKVKELTSRTKDLEEQNTSLTQDKTQLQQKIKEMERKHRATLEKNKRFLEKNIEVTNINRSLEEKIKKINDELNKLRSQTEKSRKDHDKLSEQLSTEKLDKQAVVSLREELDDMRQHTEEQEKAITALKMACTEKDRRIELLVHKRRKQRNNKAQQKTVRFILPAKVHFVANGLKETYFGYDEDSVSIDSEMSSASYLSSSHLSLDTSNEDDEVFEEFTRGDLEQSFQRLMKEHLELEKSYALLQAKVGQSHIDPQRDNKLRADLENDLLDTQSRIEDLELLVSKQGKDTGWLEEKETLNKTIRMLKEKVKSLESHQTRLTHRISEIQEQNEELEFRVLELDELNEKLKEESTDTITIAEPPQLTDDGVLQMYAAEKGHMEIKLETLKEKLHDLKYAKDGQLDKADKLVLLQARAMLGIADKKLKDLTTSQDLLKERIKKLESEKAELLSAATGVSTDLILEHEETRQTLEEAQAKITELEASIEKFKETEAVHKYTEEHSQRSEQRYKHEITDLQRQLSNSQEGREYETELWQDNHDKIKNYEKRISEIEGDIEPYKERVEVLQTENSHLQCGVTQLQCENSDLQLENTQLQTDLNQLRTDNKQLENLTAQLKTQLGAERDDLLGNLGAKIDEYDGIITELSKKSNNLEAEIEAYQIKLKASQQNENTLKEKHTESKRLLKESTDKCCHLEAEAKRLQDELDKQQSHLETKGEGILKLRIRIGELSKQVNTLTEQKQASEQKAEQLAQENADLTQQVAALPGVEQQISELQELKAQVQGHEAAKVELQNKLEELQTVANEKTTNANELQVKLSNQEAANHLLQSATNALKTKASEFETKCQEQETANRILQSAANAQKAKASDLEAKLQEQETSNRMLKSAVSALKEKAGKVDAKVKELETDNLKLTDNNNNLQKQLDKSQKDAENQISTLNTQSKTLIDKVKALEARLKEARENDVQTRDRLDLMEEEKSRRIHDLQAQVDQLEENESRLSQTITDMENVEQDLREQIAEMDRTFDSQAETLNTSWGTVTTDDVELLRQSEQTLKVKVDDLERLEKSLRDQVSELECRIEEMEQAEHEKMATIGRYQNGMEDLEQKVQELTVREAELMEDVYAMKLENQELQEHVDDLINKDNEDQHIITEADTLRTRVQELEQETSALKDDLLKAKLAAMDSLKDSEQMVEDKNTIQALQEHINELEALSEEQDNRIKDLEQSEDKIIKDLEESEKENNYLHDKVNTLIQGEEKMLEQVEFLEENQQKLNEEIQRLRAMSSASSSPRSPDEELMSRLHQLETRELELLDKLSETEEANKSLKARMNQSNTSQADELRQLREKVEILVDTEEKLVDRLGQQEQVEQKMRQQLDQYKDKADQLQDRCHQLQDELNSVRKNLDNGSKTEQQREARIREMEDKDRVTRIRVNELEKSEMMLKLKLSAAEESLQQQGDAEKQLDEEMTRLRSTDAVYRDRIAELERNDLTLRTKLSALESQKHDLLDTIQKSSRRSQNNSDSDDNITPTESSQTKSQPTHNKGATSQKHDQDAAFSVFPPTDIEALAKMPREEMISRIHELEQMEQFHMEKIRELSDNLSTFRQAVEVVAVTMETDSDIPLLNYKPKLRDEEFEARVQELVKSEVMLKLRNLDLEKREAILKTQLHEAEVMLKQQTREYRAEIEDLEADLDHTRKSEAKWRGFVLEGSALPVPWAHRLKNKLQYGGWGNDTQCLAKIQHLEDLVFELEAGERKLKRHLQEAQDNEQDLREKLARMEQVSSAEPSLKFKSPEDQDRFYELLTQVRLLEGSETDLKAKLAQLNDDSTPNLKRRIDQLETSERGLKRQLHQLDIQEARVNYEEEQSPVMLDSPEAILRQRIRELERMERHLKQQVVELERDREELHEIARKDKTLIHELNVQVRELQLSDKNHKDTLNKMEVTENNLHVKIDEMSDRIEDLEDTIKKLQATERHLRAQLQKSEYKETTLSAQLEHAKEDLLNAEAKHKRKFSELDMEKEQFVQKIHELSERVGDLEGIEISLKQKARNMENSELILKDKITEVESCEKKVKTRVEELETVNENMSQKIHKLEEEKSSLIFEMSDLEIFRSEHSEQVAKLNTTIKALNSTIREHESKKQSLQKRLDDMMERDENAQKQLQTYEKDTKDLHDHLNKLQNHIKQLTDGTGNACGHEEEICELKREITQLSTVLQAHEMLKHNHEEAKQQLRELEYQLSSGDIKVKDKPSKMSKSTQVKLADSYTIRHLAPADMYQQSEDEEFKNALRNLGARHPEAYQDFVKGLQPSDKKRHTVVRNTGHSDSPTATPGSLQPSSSTPHHTSRPLMEDSGIAEDFIVARQHTEDKVVAPGTVTAQLSRIQDRGMFKISTKSSLNHAKPHKVTEETISPVSKGGKKVSPNQDTQKPGEPVRKQLIGQLINKLPLDDTPNKPTNEDPLWQLVEDRGPNQDEKPFWAEVEGGRVDDMTLTLDIWGVTTDESGSEASNAPYQRGMIARGGSSAESEGSAPPLPCTLPPAGHPDNHSNGSYYLPSHHGDDSGDDASEIMDEDDGAVPLRSTHRAKSAERDSDFSEASYMQLGKQRRGKHLRVMAGSLESIPDSGLGSLRHDDTVSLMKDRIQDLENKLKLAKENETGLKHKLAEYEKEIKDGKQKLSEETYELEKTKRYLDDKERQVRLLKQEIDNLQKIIGAKDILLTGSTDLKADNVQFKSILEQKERELKAKTNEIDRLSQELRRWQVDSTAAQDDKSTAERSLKRVQQQLDTLSKLEKSHSQLQLDYQELQTKYTELQQQYTDLSQRSADIDSMQKMIADLRAKLTDYDRICLERQSLDKKVRALEDELKKKAKLESDLTRDNADLRHEVDSFKQQTEYYNNMEHDYNIIRSKFDEMAEIKSKALTMITPLRAKVMRFANKCKTKDELIQRLASDLRRSGDQSEAMMEADHMTTHCASEEYNRPISPMTTTNIQAFEKEVRTSDVGKLPAGRPKFTPKPTKIPRLVRHGSGGSAASDLSSSGSDIEALLDHDMINGHHGSARIILQRSHSTDELDKLVHGGGKPTIDDYVMSTPHLARQPVTQLNNNYLDTAPSNNDKVKSRTQPNSHMSDNQVFVAIKDYNPEQFSASGHQRLELPLKEGDVVRITGGVDNHGYYEGEVRGRVGLVPAIYLQPQPNSAKRSLTHSHKNVQPPSSQSNSSPEQILSLHTQLQQSHVPNYDMPSALPVSGSPVPTSRRSSGSGTNILVHPAYVRSPSVPSPSVPSLTPQSPRTVIHPAYHLGNQSHAPRSANHTPAAQKCKRRLMPLSISCCTEASSHDRARTGYRGPQSPPPIDHTKPIHKARPLIGPPEPPTNFCVQRVVGDHSILLSWTPPHMDELARSNSNVVKGYKIYINQKDKQVIPSPHMTKALIEKVSLQLGSLTFSIQTIAENGQASRLVDAIYSTKSHGGSTDWAVSGDGEMSSVMSTVQGEDSERRVFLAVYDYKPKEHSPNTHPSQELSFKTGDIIVTYGNVHDDGFYYGKVHGRKGLVPASFIEEIALLRSRGRRSVSSNVSVASGIFSPTGSLVGSNRVSLSTPDRSRPASSHSNQSVTSNSMRGSSSGRIPAAVV